MDDRIVTLQQTAAAVIGQLGPLSGIDGFGFNRESVEWVTGFVERQRARADFDENVISGLTGAIGCFLGESLIAATGGQWEWSDEFGTWSVTLGANNAAYPFAKVRKQLDAGLDGGESILGLYDVAVNYVATGKLSAAFRKDS